MSCTSLIFVLIATSLSPLCAKRSGGSFGGRKTGGDYPTSHSGNSNPSHTYPHSNGMSGNTAVHSPGYNAKPDTNSPHSYPSAPGLSGNTVHRTTNYNTKTEVHHHYHYNPPQHISYGSRQHPVYHDRPPVYVYEYRNSGSRFDTLLTGLALYNLGRMSANHHSSDYSSGRDYRGRSGEICKLGISKSNGEYEETRIECKLMSSFIWEAEREPQKEVIHPVTVSDQNTTVVDALSVKGPSVQVTAGMQCFMIRISQDTSVLKKKVECGLLQEYARSSLRYRNSSCRFTPSLCTVLISLLTYLSYL